MKPLHSDLFCASSFFRPIFFMSLVTHSIHVFSLLPFLMPPTTSKFVDLLIQSSAFLRSTCPYHLSRPRLTTLSTLSIPKPCLSSSHVLPSFMVTPDIHLTILFSVLRTQEPLNVNHLHRPSFASIHEHPLYTRS